MAGGLVKYRHLGRDSAHRKALLRNLVTSLIERESIHTTWYKAKEAQRLAEKLITLAKRNNEETRRKAQAILFTPHLHMPKLFGTLRERYADRPGGYTRVLLTEPKKDDQARSAILELVDGPQDLRFALTAAAVARDRDLGQAHHPTTERNWAKVVQFRKNGEDEFEAMVDRTRQMRLAEPGLEMADMEPTIMQRTDDDERLRKAKPLQDYWARDRGAARTDELDELDELRNNFGATGSRGEGRKKLAKAIGMPSKRP